MDKFTRDIMLEAIEMVNNEKITENPNFITAVALKDKLIEEGSLDIEIINVIVSNLKINVCKEFVEDEIVFKRAIEVYSNKILEVRDLTVLENIPDYLFNYELKIVYDI